MKVAAGRSKPKPSQKDEEAELFGAGLKYTADGTPSVDSKSLTPALAKDLDSKFCPTCNGTWSKHGMTAGQWSTTAALVTNLPTSLYMRCTPEQHAWIERFDKAKKNFLDAKGLVKLDFEKEPASAPAPQDVPAPAKQESPEMKIQLSSFLGYEDIPDDKDTVVTIKAIELTMLGQGKDAKEKYIFTFKEFDKNMVCNKTNMKSIVKALETDETDDMIGKKIALFVKDDVEFQGEQLSAIRVRNKAPKAEKKGVSSAADEDSDVGY